MTRQLLVAALFLAHIASAQTVLVVGGSHGEGETPGLKQLEARLRGLDPQSTVVVFTGEYASQALPVADDPLRATVEREIIPHVKATADFVARGGRVYFLPGATDFPNRGTTAVRRLKAFLNESYEAAGGQRGIDVMPHAACATPTLMKLSDKVGLLLVNSQWWMQDGYGDPELNEGCGLKNRRALYEEVTDVFREYRDRRLIIASHHPLASYGEYGGAFGPAAHLSPVPLVGTAWVLARQWGLVPQYANDPQVRSFVELLRDNAEVNGAYLFASGHDANLQYLPVMRQTQVISGSTAHAGAPAASAGPGAFSAPSSGWAELGFEPSGEGTVQLFSSAGARLFGSQLPPGQRAGAVPSGPAPALPEGPVLADYSTKPVWKLPGAVQALTGSFYSEAFTLKLPYEVLDLQTEQGGLTPYRIGGGVQTNSVRLHDPEGGDWSMRSTTKDASRLPPYPWNTVQPVERVIDYASTATHPEAALAVPPLASAVGVLHPEPRLMYLPDQQALGEYRGFVGNEVVLLERRPAKVQRLDELRDELMTDPSTHRLDQEAMLRARLLDMFLGDWDRHRAQWRFAAVKGDDGITRYQPIALDRDQVFSNYDGAALMLARLLIPRARSLQPYTGTYGRIGWLNYNARDVDPFTLNRIPYDRWMAITAQVQVALTDEVIDEAMSTWHPETYALDGKRIAEAMKARRDGLPAAAEEFYAQLSKNVDVLGSKGPDVFDVWFEDHGRVSIQVRPRDPGAPTYFQRTFHPSETRELRLYALEGDDLLRVHGAPHERIDIGFIGGEGQDTIAAASAPKGQRLRAAAIRLFDDHTATIDPSIAVRDERSTTLARINQYEAEADHEPDYGFFLPGLEFRSGEQLWVGGTYTHVFNAFKKRPFASRHELGGFLGTSFTAAEPVAGDLTYRGLFPESLNLLDQQVDLTVRTAGFARNFFGITNTVVDDPDVQDFYRVRQAHYGGRYGLFHTFLDGRARIGAQLGADAIVTDETAGRFVTASPDVSAGDFGPRYFIGGRLLAEVNTFDSLTLPRQGVALQASGDSRFDVRHGNQLSTNWRGVGAAAIPFERTRRLVLLSRVSAEGIVGDHPFFFAPTLGATQLRAYHLQQLAGDVAFVNSNDLRLDVVRIRSVLPGTIGISAGLDHGRVFGSKITDDTWHVNYGGGLWWSIVDQLGVSASYFRGVDGGQRFIFEVGPLFANTGF